MSQKNLYIAAAVAALVLIIGLIAATVAPRSAPPAPAATSAQELDQALLQTQTQASAPVPATGNPVKQATPAVNPVEATNPFNDTGSASGASGSGYQNPF